MVNLSIDRPGNLIAVCGNSGSGKSTLVRHALGELPKRLRYMNTYTTRKQRPGEDSVEYTFVDTESYDQIRQKAKLWDESSIYGNLYGLDAAVYLQALQKGENIVFCSVPSSEIIDAMRSIYGAQTLKTIHLLTDLETSHERARSRDGGLDLGRVALDSTVDSSFIADYQLGTADSIQESQKSFVQLIRRIIA